MLKQGISKSLIDLLNYLPVDQDLKVISISKILSLLLLLDVAVEVYLFSLLKEEIKCTDQICISDWKCTESMSDGLLFPWTWIIMKSVILASRYGQIAWLVSL